MTRKYFGTDGIRGRANEFPMTAEIALKVAKAAAIVLKNQRNGHQTNRVIIGKDTRLSSYMFEEVMCAGFLAVGMEALLVGPIPTPGIALLTKSMRADLGVMISASHNPYEDNGIKLFGADGYKLDDAIEAEIEALMDEDLSERLAAASALGKATRLDDALGRYAEYVKTCFPKDKTLEGLKVVVDCAHGAAYKVAPQILWELEADVVAIGVTPNGRNINDGFGATATENLQKKVVEEGADIGLAFDGDADRLIVVDEKGQKVDGDQIMAALALSMRDQGTLRNNALVATVMSNLGLEKKLEAEGVTLIRTQVGDRYVMEEMKKGGYNIGGEQSGHIIMSDYATTGDGLMAALQILTLVSESDEPASTRLKMFESYPQILKNVRFSGASPMESKNLQDAIARAENELATNGRILVRPSGTEPLIRVMAEGKDSTQVESVVDMVCDAVRKETSAAA